MKTINTIILFFIASLTFGLFAQTAPCNGVLPFEEKNGILTIEMESGILNDDRWKVDSETVAGEEITYLYWTGPESFNALTGAPIVYKIKINTPGTYRFAWRMRVGFGTSKGEHNDAWLKVDGEDFYGILDGSKVYPKPRCSSDANLTCAAGSSTQNFIKAFGNRLDWGFVTNTNDGLSHKVYVTFNEAKEYTITVDARSSYLFVDKMVLYRSNVTSSTAFNLDNSESSCYDASLSVDADHMLSQINVFPNPATHTLLIDNLPVDTTLVITNMHGITMKTIYTSSRQETIDVRDLKSGIYFLTGSSNTFSFTKKIIKL